MLELPGRQGRPGRRYFLEAETGSHSIAAASEEKRGATTAKLERYEEFTFGIAGHHRSETHYRLAYPDGFEPTVLFLVRNLARQSSVNRAIAAWRDGRAGQALRAQAFTVERAAAEVLNLLGVAASAAASPPPTKPKKEVVSAEVRLVRGFYDSAIRSLKTARARARARQEPVPAYPDETERVGDILKRLDNRG